MKDDIDGHTTIRDKSSSVRAPDFRLLAIAGDTDQIDRVHEAALRFNDVRFGLMLRDPEHSPERVRELAARADAKGLPPNVCLISNSVRVPAASFLHRTSSQLLELTNAAIPTTIAEGPFGASAHSLEEAEHAARLGASYITLSPIFPTSSKPGHPGIGIDPLARIASALTIPIFALGGMNDLERITAALDAGTHGIASISLFASDSYATLERVIGIWKEEVGGRSSRKIR